MMNLSILEAAIFVFLSPFNLIGCLSGAVVLIYKTSVQLCHLQQGHAPGLLNRQAALGAAVGMASGFQPQQPEAFCRCCQR